MFHVVCDRCGMVLDEVEPHHYIIDEDIEGDICDSCFNDLETFFNNEPVEKSKKRFNSVLIEIEI